MPENDFAARDAALAIQLMGYTHSPNINNDALYVNHNEVCFRNYPPRFEFRPSQDPVAFDKLVKELEKRGCEMYLHDHIDEKDARLCYWDVYRHGICSPIETAPDYMQALVLACTEEGKFCPKCYRKLTPKPIMLCIECGNLAAGTEPLPARVRPELMKGKYENYHVVGVNELI